MPAGQVESSFSMTIVETRLLGHTTRTRVEFEQFLLQIYKKFTPETYDLLRWNCNHFSDTCARFLLGNHGIPRHILDLPNIVSSTFLGSLILKVFHRFTQGWNPVLFSPDHPRHPCHQGSLMQGNDKNAPSYARPHAIRHAKSATRIPVATTAPAARAFVPPLKTPSLEALSPISSPLTTRTLCTSDCFRDIWNSADAWAVPWTFENDQQQRQKSTTTSVSRCKPAAWAEGHHLPTEPLPHSREPSIACRNSAPGRQNAAAHAPLTLPLVAATFGNCFHEHDGMRTPMTSRAIGLPEHSIGATERNEHPDRRAQVLPSPESVIAERRAGETDKSTESCCCTVGISECRQKKYQQRCAYIEKSCCDKPPHVNGSGRLATPEPLGDSSVVRRVPNLLCPSRSLFERPTAEPFTPHKKASFPMTKMKANSLFSSQQCQQPLKKASRPSLAPLLGTVMPSASAPPQTCLTTYGACSQQSSRMMPQVHCSRPSKQNEKNAEQTDIAQNVSRLTFVEMLTPTVRKEDSNGSTDETRDGSGPRVAQLGRSDMTAWKGDAPQHTWRQRTSRIRITPQPQPPSQQLFQPQLQPLSQQASPPLPQAPSQLPCQSLVQERVDDGSQMTRSFHPIYFYQVENETPLQLGLALKAQKCQDAQDRHVSLSGATTFRKIATTTVAAPTAAAATGSTLFPHSCAQKASPAPGKATSFYCPTKTAFKILATPCPECGTPSATHREGLRLRCDCFSVTAVTAR